MVGPWTYEDTGKYYREAVKRRPSFSGRRDMLQFTDRLPSTDDWTLPVLLQLNRTLRVLYNGPFNWDAFKKIVMQHILTNDVLDALKALPEDEQIPHLVQLVLDWACWDAPKEGAWPRDLSMRRYFVKWRRCEPFYFEADTHTDEDMERAADLFLDIWMANDRLHAATPVQFGEEKDFPGFTVYRVRDEAVTDAERLAAAQSKELYLNLQARGWAPERMDEPLQVGASVARPAKLPPPAGDIVICGPGMCAQCIKKRYLECRVPQDGGKPRCVACRVHKLGCEHKGKTMDALKKQSLEDDSDSREATPDPSQRSQRSGSESVVSESNKSAALTNASADSVPGPSGGRKRKSQGSRDKQKKAKRARK
ncbi:uncharacterized protein C8Q71DRAFT_910438 [Rhodofomes roseus]|uniref:Zn(2)-C6 fungal-type domain-containing protein n=1 Tax=Rhodofomes roseus TaxID=34475 RepID=A0ABQ8K577_9APHY|nr:uncharacterized protein C8Q71DRAFT_910438 [Rhodofomes roseus]KAH9832120.1 hypothetical protein C8Q71DRAFT_910438 [Rhodofomes roseus]